MMTTFNTLQSYRSMAIFFCSLSSILGSNREIGGGNTYLGTYLPEKMNLVETEIYC